jgi:hypothetical protein
VFGVAAALAVLMIWTGDAHAQSPVSEAATMLEQAAQFISGLSMPAPKLRQLSMTEHRQFS